MPARDFLVVVVALVALAGCTRALGPAAPTAAEQALIDRITADRFIFVTRLDRDDQGRLLITTRQGDATIRYWAVKPPDGGDRLLASRAADEPQLEVADDGHRGTFVDEQRGLRAKR